MTAIDLARDHVPRVHHGKIVPGRLSGGEGQRDNATHGRSVLPPSAFVSPERESTSDPLTKEAPPHARGYDELRLFAESFEDAQRARVAASNRLGAAEREGSVDPDSVRAAVDLMERAEHQWGLAMRRCFRRVAPGIRGWVSETPGLGEHLVARLLGVIGDPAIAYPHHWEVVDQGPRRAKEDAHSTGVSPSRVLVNDPSYVRTVPQLWSYCGHGDATRKRKAGMSQADALKLGNPRAKMLVHLIAEGAMKCVGSETRKRSPYRDVYDAARIAYLDRDWTDLHRHNAALRMVGKQFLADLHEQALR